MANNVVSMERPLFLSVAETVKATGLSEYYIRQELKAGKIPHIRCGRRVLINYNQLAAMLDQMSTTSPITP